jgi:outer membrane protein
MTRKLFMFFIAVMVVTVSFGQGKYGHVNMGNLMELMPDVKAADQELKNLETSLLEKQKGDVEKFQAEAGKYQKEMQEGTLSKIQAQAKEQVLSKQQETLQNFEREAQAQMSQKREALMTPILTKINDAIKAIGKEGGYSIIFDTSTGAMLFADETVDLTKQVKTKLGLL